jgi:hypothetical protein
MMGGAFVADNECFVHCACRVNGIFHHSRSWCGGRCNLFCDVSRLFAVFFLPRKIKLAPRCCCDGVVAASLTVTRYCTDRMDSNLWISAEIRTGFIVLCSWAGDAYFLVIVGLVRCGEQPSDATLKNQWTVANPTLVSVTWFCNWWPASCSDSAHWHAKFIFSGFAQIFVFCVYVINIRNEGFYSVYYYASMFQLQILPLVVSKRTTSGEHFVRGGGGGERENVITLS